jgi:hypothetical protein
MYVESNIFFNYSSSWKRLPMQLFKQEILNVYYEFFVQFHNSVGLHKILIWPRVIAAAFSN